MNDIRISIIIPAYNEARTLPACLDAIVAQTMRPHEVIVVDNNSTDHTAAVIARYPFVTLLHESRQGVVYARNAGFDKARGTVIARIDADARLPADWIERVTRFYEQPGSQKLAFTGGCRFYNLRTGYVTGRIYDLIVHRVNALLLGYYFPWGSNSALPVEGWHAVRDSVILRNDIHEDLDLGIHLRAAGYATVYMHNVRVHAMAKRILSDRGQLWPYAAMWPRTFKLNNALSWPLVWPFALMVWLGSYWVLATEKMLALYARNKKPA